MRVIGGKYKRRRFDVPRTFKARPTTDFAKENIFNVLSNHIDFEDGVRALDLFAGTGSITVELLSRGCDNVVSVEKDSAHCNFIGKVLKELGDENCFLVKGDVLKYVSGSNTTFDFIFADPPYALKELPLLPSLILDETDILSPDGIFVLEHGKEYDFSDNPHFIDHRAYGSVNFSIFSKKRAEDSDD